MKIRRPGGEPGGVHEYADAFPRSEVAATARGAGVDPRQQLLEHLPILLDHGDDAGFALLDHARRMVALPRLDAVLGQFVLEDVGRPVVFEELPEERQDPWLGNRVRVEDSPDVDRHLVGRPQEPLPGGVEHAALPFHAQRQAHRQGDLPR